MPLHEYLCQECEARFEAITPAAKADDIRCPMCRSAETRRLISVIAGVGGRASGSSALSAPDVGAGGCCGGSCGCAR